MMMSRVRMLLLSLVAVIVLSAIGSASASAQVWEECLPFPGGIYLNNGCLVGPPNGWEWLPIVQKLPVNISLGAQRFVFPLAGLAIECKKGTGKSDFEPEGKDNSLTVVYTGCEVEKPTGCKYISSEGAPNGLIALAANLPSKLFEKEGAIYDEIEENPTLKEFGTVKVRKEEAESSAKCGLVPKVSKLTGAVIGKINNATQELEFKEEGTLKGFGAIEGKYSGNGLFAAETGNAMRAT